MNLFKFVKQLECVLCEVASEFCFVLNLHTGSSWKCYFSLPYVSRYWI